MKKLILLSVFLISLVSFGQKKLYVDDMGNFQNGYLVVRKGDHLRFIDTTGTELEIDNINLHPSENSGILLGMQKNGFFINKNNNRSFLDGQDGIRNLKGEYVIAPKYNITRENGYYIVEHISNLRTISYKVLDENCDSIFSISESFRSKRPIIPLTDNIIAIANKESYSVRYKLLFIAEGRETDYVYGDFGNTKNGFIKAAKYIKSEGKFKWGFLNEKGEVVIDFVYTNPPGDFDNHLAVVKNLEGKFGYINDKNEVVIEPTLIKAYGFINGKALVRVHKPQYKNGRTEKGYRIINTKGEIIYDLEDLEPFLPPYDYYKQTVIEKNNTLILRNSKSKGCILNLDNLELIQTGFSSMGRFDSGLSLVTFFDDKNQSQKGFANKKGELIFIKAKREF